MIATPVDSMARIPSWAVSTLPLQVTAVLWNRACPVLRVCCMMLVQLVLTALAFMQAGLLSASEMTVGLVAAFVTVLCIILADTGAYFCGKSLGRTQLISISPKKTVEGAVGGLLCSVAGAVACQPLLAWPASPLAAALLGTIIFFSSLFGDLIESVIKRDAGVKDASNLIPGHGGLLDRLDSYLFTGAVVYFYIKFLLPA